VSVDVKFGDACVRNEGFGLLCTSDQLLYVRVARNCRLRLHVFAGYFSFFLLSCLFHFWRESHSIAFSYLLQRVVFGDNIIVLAEVSLFRVAEQV
jgi:hypothetical protein